MSTDTTTTTLTWDDFFTSHVSDEALENAGGMSPMAMAGSSLWSTSNASGCTC
jgi:hypothetical protein